MSFPTLPVRAKSRQMVDAFGGYNHNIRIGDGEFFDMQNLTSDHYPVLSPRAKRGFYAKPASPQGLIAKDKLCYVDGADFVIGSQRIEMQLSVEAKDCPKQLVSMGAYVIIMPDKKYINTMNTEDRGSLDAQYTSTGEVSFQLCTAAGETYENVTVSPTAPAAPGNLDYWIDTSSVPNALKQYAATTGSWVSVATTYIRIGASGIGKAFELYDGISIDGITAEPVKDINGSAAIWGKGDDYIVVVGILDKVTSQNDPITVTRKAPVMDFVVESGNRLWGCRYGENLKGEVVNEIYCSKLGDFKNWNCFMGLSTDSYAASCGSDGPFTGAVTYLGLPTFFKENYIHKVYGSYPSNFQIQDTACRGVQPGCENSLAIVNEILYYKARSCVCAYDGAQPTEISHALGADSFYTATGGGIGNKYYLSMQDSNGKWNLFVYDTSKGMWHKEDDLHASQFCAHNGELYCVDAKGQNIITMLGSGAENEGDVQWMAQTGELGVSSPDMKYVSQISIRMMMDIGASMDIYIQYDNSDEWLHICKVFGTDLRSFAVPVKPRRSDYFRLKILGKGCGKIYSITKTIEQGSALS